MRNVGAREECSKRAISICESHFASFLQRNLPEICISFSAFCSFLSVFMESWAKQESKPTSQFFVIISLQNTSHRGENTDLPYLNFYQIAYNRLLFALSFFWHTANICHSANLRRWYVLCITLRRRFQSFYARSLVAANDQNRQKQ